MRHDEILGLLPHLNYSSDYSPGLLLFGLELLFWAIVAVFTIALVRYRPMPLEKAENWLREVSQHKRFWFSAFVLGVIVVRLALLHWIPIPIPVVHDEFSYILGGDTFAHGRLTNPASPMWVHFESFHINMLPTYQSMYPPAQAFALAIGQKLTTVPWVGVLLSTALMCGAIYWMLLGWLPAPWAWLGGALACVRFGIFSYWMNSYFGGSVAAIGGALILGALARFRKQPRIRMALVLAFGLLILANSRPLEGALFSLPIVFAVAFALIKRIRSRQVTWGAATRIVLPATVLLAIGAAWMLYYNWRGTGNPMLMPYQLNFETYHISKPFLFQTPNSIPVYRHPSMRTFYVFHELPDLLRYKYDLGYVFRLRANIYYVFFIWPFSLLIGPGLYAMWRSEMRVVLLSVALLAVDLFVQIWPPHSHYAAPALGAMFLALLYSVRHFRNTGSQYGIWGSRAAAIVLGLWMISPIADKLYDPYMLPRPISGSPVAVKTFQMPMQIKRARVQSELEAHSGKQLIFIHYPYKDVPSQDWIYNDADIDHAHIVWARDMGYLRNKELMNYYPDRQAWYIDRGDASQMILPYDQVMAPMALAFKDAPPETVSQLARSVSPIPSPTITKTVSLNPAKVITQHSR
jgi:hypothetical protein